MKKVFCFMLVITMLLTTLTFTAFAAEEVIITTADSLCKMEGNGWAESTNPVAAGPLDGTSWYTNEKEASVTYDASQLAKGSYGVYLYMTPVGTTADKVDVTITASGKATTLVTNGLDGGNLNRHWMFLGKYDFDGSHGDSVKQKINPDAVPVNGTGNKGALRTSGVKFIKDDTNTEKVGYEVTTTSPSNASKPKFTTISETGNVIMGSEHHGFSKSGSWQKSGLIMPAEGKGFYTNGVGDSGIWYPYISKADNVEIFYLKPNATATEDPGLEVEIFADGEVTKLVIDFTVPPTDWFSLGRYNFSGDGSEYVKITKINPVGTARLTCLMFSRENGNKGPKPEDSAFFGTDLHIVERMGMLIGEGDGITEEYLKKVPTRVQAAIMVLRLNGVDKEAESFAGTDNFADSDLTAWAKPQLAYLKAHPEFGLIGTGDNMFEPTANIDEQAYAKILLTALGYEYNVDFTWDETLAYAAEKGIAKAKSSTFTVKDLAIMTASALKLNCKDGTPYLEYLIAKREGVKDDGVFGTELSEELKAARDVAKNKKRGIIYNNDGNDVYSPYPEYPGTFDISHLDGTTINAENFLKARTYGLEDTQVGTVFYGTGVFNSYHHESTGLTDVRVRDWSRALKQYTGKDSLTTMIDYVHSLDKEIFWSMRMNDTHDFEYEENQLDPWKQKNLDLLMFRKSEAIFMKHGDKRWSSVDYTLLPVRQIVYDIVKDTLTRYDLDGIELDFTRWPIFFKETTEGYDIYPENIERMNNLIRMIRDMTEKVSIERNKPILLSMYVPDSMDFLYDSGLDIKKWLEEGLIDIVAVGGVNGKFQTWEDGLDEYKGYDVQVYAAFDYQNYGENKSEWATLNPQEAILAYEAGADGVYMYNAFDINHSNFDILGSIETCGEKDPNYESKIVPYVFNIIKDVEKYVKIGK